MNKKKNQPKLKEHYDFSSFDLLEIGDIMKLLTKAKSKSKTYDCPFLPNIIIKEFYLNMRPEKEDIFYANHPIFLQNIRKGNSIIEFQGDGSTKTERFICRKGLMKFFDLHINYLRKSKLSWNDELIKNLILGEVEIALKEKKQVIVYKASKENGTNTQISYIERIDAWLIASKNNSILIRNENDVQSYDKAEFFLPNLIGLEWLKIIKGFEKDVLEQFKKELSGFTLVGEFIGGDKTTSRLLKYQIQELRFITLIKIKEQNTCVVPTQAIDFFKRYELNSVKFEKIIEAVNFSHLCDELRNLHQKISSSTIAEEGEGAVLYLVIKDPLKPLEVKVASLCKMKTLEYRFFRKIREKLKKIRGDKEKFPKNLLKVFSKEVEQLCAYCECDLDINFYIKVAEEFFNQVIEHYNKSNFKKCVNQFGHYIEKVVYCVKNNIKKNIFDDEMVIIIAPPHYFNEIVEKAIEDKLNLKLEKKFDKNLFCKKETNKILLLLENLDIDLNEIAYFAEKINFLVVGFDQTAFERISKIFPEITINNLVSLKENIDNKIKSIQQSKIFYDKDLLIDEINGSIELINCIKVCFESFNEILKSAPKAKNPQNLKRLIAFIPLGIPCMGKTAFMGFIESFMKAEGYHFYTISSDKIHKELIDEVLKKNKGKKNNFEEIREKTSKQSKNLFVERFSILMKSINSSNENLHVLFVDKNHPPNGGIEKAIKLLKDNVKKGIDLKVIAIAPKCVNPLKINHNEFPFSLNFLITCLKRSCDRKDHDTLQGDDQKVFDVIMMFFKFYRGFKINLENIQNQGFDYLINLSYVCETENSDEKISENLKGLVKEYLKKVKDSDGNIQNLVEAIRNEDIELQEIKGDSFVEELKVQWTRFLNFLEKTNGGDNEEEDEEEIWDSCDIEEDDDDEEEEEKKN